jgi:hypothetical protein
MTFKVQDLISSLNKQGVAKASLFEVQITGPGDSGEERDLMFRADTAELPGRTISTSEYRTYGPIRKIAYASTYTDTTIGFLCSADLREKRYFENWQDVIMNHRSTSAPSAKQSRGRYEVGYYNDYARTIDIRTYDESGRKMTTHTLDEAYPIGIAPIAVTWGSEELVRLAITFAFHDYRVDFTPGPAVAQSPNIGISGSVTLGGVRVGGNLNLGDVLSTVDTDGTFI